MKIIANERLHLEKAKEFITKNRVNCDFNYTTSVEACLSQQYTGFVVKAFEEFKAAGGDVSHIKVYHGEVAKTKARHPSAVCAYEWPAGSNHPSKLTHWILNDVIRSGVRLWTYCPAIKVVRHHEPAATAGLRWDIHTPRGVINVNTVVHCTNAYAAFLLPQLARFVTPRSSQVHSFIPTGALAGEDLLQNTLSLRYHHDHFFSVNQSLVDGTIIIGGTGTRTKRDADSVDRVTIDDSIYSESLANNTRNEFLTLAGATNETLRPGEGLDQAWTGITGITADDVPMIGPISGLEGQWICAGFNGHGKS